MFFHLDACVLCWRGLMSGHPCFFRSHPVITNSTGIPVHTGNNFTLVTTLLESHIPQAAGVQNRSNSQILWPISKLSSPHEGRQVSHACQVEFHLGGNWSCLRNEKRIYRELGPIEWSSPVRQQMLGPFMCHVHISHWGHSDENIRILDSVSPPNRSSEPTGSFQRRSRELHRCGAQGGSGWEGALTALGC